MPLPHQQVKSSGLTPQSTNSQVRSVSPYQNKSYEDLEQDRLLSYNLDYPDDKASLQRLQLDPQSRFYSRSRPRSLDLPELLPYDTESPRERARFLAHIVAHLYIAIKTLDIQGALSVSAKDLAAIREFTGISEVELAESMVESTPLPESITPLPESMGGEELEDEEYGHDADAEDGDDIPDADSADNDDDSDLDADNDREEPSDIMETGESANQHRRLPRMAVGVSVRVWTQELLVWLKMKYNMPVSLRVALAKVYYSISCCRGQHVNVKVYAKVFDTLTKNIDLVRRGGLCLPWEPIYSEVAVHLPLADLMHESFEKKDLGMVLKLAERASHFFEPLLLPLLFGKLVAQFSISNAAIVLWSMRLLPQNFVDDYGNGKNDNLDMRHYILPLIYMWKKLGKSGGVDTHLTTALGRVAMYFLMHVAEKFQLRANANGRCTESGHLSKSGSETAATEAHTIEIRNELDKPENGTTPIICLGKFGVFSEEEFIYMINTLLNSLSINSQKFASMKSKFFHGFASAVVFSINGDRALEPCGILAHIQNLINAIESFVHPSNTGEWSKPISKLVLSLVYQFHKRFNMEREPNGGLYNSPQSIKLSDEVVNKFVECVLPVVRIGLQSKRQVVMEQYLVALEFLAHVDSEQTLSRILPDIYESLDGVISTHRVVTAMRCMEQLTRYFVATRSFRVHVPRLLSLLLPGIDSNDLQKTTHALNIFAAAANYVPFVDLTDGDGDEELAMQFTNTQLEYLQSKNMSELEPEEQNEFVVEDEIEVAALRSASSSLKFLIKCFARRLFALLENIPDPTKSDGAEKELCESLPKLIYMMLEAMSDDIFCAFRSEFEGFVFDTVLHHVADEVGLIFGGLTKRDPLYFKELSPTLIARIREEIEENGAGQARSGDDIVPRDQALFWYLLILNECVGNAGEYIIDMSQALNELLVFLMENVKARLGFSITHLVSQMIQGATEIRLRESRLISPMRVVDESCWGGFQFDEYRFSQENLAFEWFVPTVREVSFAVETFRSHVTRALSNVVKTLKKKENDNEAPKDNEIEKESPINLDEWRTTFLYLAFGLSGILFLLDPSFDEDFFKFQPTKYNELFQIGSDQENVHDSLVRIVQELQTPTKIDENFTEKNKVPWDVPFRENNIYTSHYFFGESISKRARNPLYIHVHRLRHLVGRALHVLCRHMDERLVDDTKLFKHLLYALDVFFNAVGKERNLSHCHMRVPYSFDNELQQISRVRKPFSRITFGSRIELYHMFRTSLHGATRSMSELDRVLVQDVTKLACSPYQAVGDPAHSTLVDVLKRVNGSYGVILRHTMRHLSKALSDDDHRRIEGALGVFELRKFARKFHADYVLLRRFMDLLQQCLCVDNEAVATAAQGIYKDLCAAVCSPRKCCLLPSLVEAIRPPDEGLDKEVQIIIQTKEKKRTLQLLKIMRLQDAVVIYEQTNTHWRTSYFNLMFLIQLLLDYELEFRSDAFQLVTSALTSDHPLVAKLAVRGIVKIFHRLLVQSSYDYDLDQAYMVGSVTKDQKVIDTHPRDGESFYQTWMAEISTPNPTYFWDNKCHRGWLFWDHDMVMVSPEPSELFLSGKDTTSIRLMGNQVDRDWLADIVNSWIDDNEATPAFQGLDVSFISVVVMLLAGGYTPQLTLQELFSLVEEAYEPDDKASHVVVCELILGLLFASRYLTPEWKVQRDAFIVSFMHRVLNDITPETRHVWNILFSYVPAHVDSRRYPAICNMLLLFDIPDDLAVLETTILSYIRGMVSANLWGLPNREQIVEMCFSNFENRYQAIREQNGSLLAVVLFTYYGDSFQDVDAFVNACSDQEKMRHRCTDKQFFLRLSEMFTLIEESRVKVAHLLAQKILHSAYFYRATTMMGFLTHTLNTSIAVQFQEMVCTHIMPFLLQVIGMKEVCLLGSVDPYIVFKQASQISFERPALEAVLQMIEDYAHRDLLLLQNFALGEFVEIVYFKNLFTLTARQRKRILDVISHTLFHKCVEIRDALAITLSGLVHATPPAEIESIVEIYRKRYSAVLSSVRKKYKGTGLKNIYQQDTVQLHGATLGLGALVHAFTFTSPPPRWIPDILTILSKMASGIPGIVGKSAKETLGKFKKTRQDSWHIDSKAFSEEQMQALEGVLWKSYFI